MAAILYSAILNSAILDSAIFLKFLTPTNSIWPKVIHSDSTWWWQWYWILPFWIQTSLIHLLWDSLSKTLSLAKIGSHHLDSKKPSLIHSDSTWWWQPSWILLGWILNFSSILRFTPSSLSSLILTLRLLTLCQTHWAAIPICQPFCTKKLHLFILTQFDDGSHLEFFHVGFETLPSWIQTPCYLLSDLLKNTLSPLWLWLKLIQSDSNSFILT